MPRPYVATTSRFGSSGFRFIVEIGTNGRPLSETKSSLPFVFVENTPTSVPTISCLPRSVTHVAGTSGRLPETSVNDSPPSVDLYRWPAPTLLDLSCNVPGGTQRVL